MRTVSLHGKKAAGRVALVDLTAWGTDAYELVSRYRWHARDSGHPGGRRTTYAVTSVRLPDGHQKTLALHTLLTGWPEVDHENHDGLDNRRCNLRPATQGQNLANARKQARPTSSWYRGVSWHKARGRWRGYIQVNGRQRHIAYFDDELEAAAAFDAEALWEWGEFACLNFGEDSSRPS
jgi:hypothetical protein